MKTYALATLGCKVNQYESESIRRLLGACRQVAFGETADFYIINTCGVTAEADSKARQLIRRARRAAPEGRLVLTGCYRPEEKTYLSGLGIDLFVGNAEKNDLAAILLGGNPSGTVSPPVPRETAPQARTRAFIKVQDGCDQRCSYCAIPDFRGRPRSRPAAEVVAEIATTAAAGVAEVVLTGIHLGKYGADLETQGDLADLVEAILAQTALPRLRLSSLESLEATDRLIGLIATEARLADHLHLPLQSGSDRILRAMNRPYTVAEFLAVAAGARAAAPDIGLTTDVMVGFPGESAADFAATMSAVDRAAFSRIHVFKYSPRPGTPAADFPDQIPAGVKNERAAAVREAGQTAGSRFAARFAGRVVSALAEPERGGEQRGLTAEYVRVKFKHPVAAAGRISRFWVDRAEGEFLIGGPRDE